MSRNEVDILHVFPNFGGGGPEVRTADLINCTGDQLRHAVLSISGDLSGCSRIRATPMPPCVAAEGRSVWRLRQSIRNFRPEAVFTYGWGGVDAILAARLAGQRRVVHHEDGFLPDECVKERRVRQLARRFAFRYVAHLVVPSQALVNIARVGWRVPEARLKYLPNGVDTVRFRPAADPIERESLRRTLGLPSEGVFVVSVGGLRPEKNNLRLLLAFASVADRFHDAVLVFIGDGPEETLLREEAARSGLRERVHFLGGVQDPAPYYRAMDIFALSSDTEQMPLVLLEAMATELPAVSTDVGDVLQMVTPVNRSYVTPLGDDAGYANKLACLLANATERREVGVANRLRCLEMFSLERMVESHRELYYHAVR